MLHFRTKVGRVRHDFSAHCADGGPQLTEAGGYGIDMFISGDQLLKGAALNAVQIAELLLEK